MQYLMDLLASELGEPASKIYRHSLMGSLETAIRSSNAQYHDPEFLNRLDIKLLEASPGDRGWEIFQLDYRLNDLPMLQTIFADEVMIVFQKINNFLWKLKRVDHGLSTSWGLGVAHSNEFFKIPGMKNRFHRFYLAHQEMAHFVNNIHNYIMVEVLESAWKIFHDELKQVQNLDELIEVQ
jgi:gamma-tubulin complex component 3